MGPFSVLGLNRPSRQPAESFESKCFGLHCTGSPAPCGWYRPQDVQGSVVEGHPAYFPSQPDSPALRCPSFLLQ